jgi:hypothetical protein
MSYTVLKSKKDFEEYKKATDRGDLIDCGPTSVEHIGEEPTSYPCLVRTEAMQEYFTGDIEYWYHYFTYPSDVLEMAKALEMNP